jgi:hypothetical protein
VNVLKHLWTSISNLAESLNGLAAVVQAVSDQVRQRTGIRTLDADPPLLPESNGEAEPTAVASGRKRRSTP